MRPMRESRPSRRAHVWAASDWTATSAEGRKAKLIVVNGLTRSGREEASHHVDGLARFARRSGDQCWYFVYETKADQRLVVVDLDSIDDGGQRGAKGLREGLIGWSGSEDGFCNRIVVVTQDDVFFGGEVAIEGRRRGLGGVGDLFDRRSFVPLRFEES